MFSVDSKASEAEESPYGFFGTVRHYFLSIYRSCFIFNCLLFLFRLFWLCAFCPKRLFIQWLCSRIRICFKLEESGFWAESCFFGTMRLFRKNRINFRKRHIFLFPVGEAVVPESYMYPLEYFWHWELFWLRTYLLFNEVKRRLIQNIYNHQLTDS